MKPAGGKRLRSPDTPSNAGVVNCESDSENLHPDTPPKAWQDTPSNDGVINCESDSESENLHPDTPPKVKTPDDIRLIDLNATDEISAIREATPVVDRSLLGEPLLADLLNEKSERSSIGLLNGIGLANKKLSAFENNLNGNLNIFKNSTNAKNKKKSNSPDNQPSFTKQAHADASSSSNTRNADPYANHHNSYSSSSKNFSDPNTKNQNPSDNGAGPEKPNQFNSKTNNTKSDIRSDFDYYNSVASHSTANVAVDVLSKTGLIQQTEELRVEAMQVFPSEIYSSELIQFAACALSMFRCRLSEAPLPLQLLLLWLTAGGSRIRAHAGEVYQYQDGSFEIFDGSMDYNTYEYIHRYLTNVEGSFYHVAQTAPDLTKRDSHGFLTALRNSYHLLRTNDNSDTDIFYIWGLCAFDEDFEIKKAGEPVHWLERLGKVVFFLSKELRKNLLNEKLAPMISEWCRTDSEAVPGIVFNDTAIIINDSNQSPYVTHVKNLSPNNNIYFRVHTSLRDPVLESHRIRLLTFFEQTFYKNHLALQKTYSAIALAIRGENIDRVDWSIGPGGVGQSLLTALIDNIFDNRHSYADTHIFYLLEEARKQLPSLSRQKAITFQEKVEGGDAKKILLHIYKKIASADPIAGRVPYGRITQMLSIHGWKRMELNSVIQFDGITENEFNSIFRRMMVTVFHGRFFDTASYNDIIKQDPSAGDHGKFLADPSLKDFLKSPASRAAMYKIIYGYMRENSKSECRYVIETHVKNNLITEQYARRACGLPTKAAPTTNTDTDDHDNNINVEEQRLFKISQQLASRLLRDNIDSNRSNIQKCNELGTTLSIRCNTFQTLLTDNYWLKHGHSTNSTNRPENFAPNITSSKDPDTITPGRAKVQPDKLYKEMYNADAVRKFHQCPARRMNEAHIRLWAETSISNITKKDRWWFKPEVKQKHDDFNNILEKIKFQSAALNSLFNEICTAPLPSNVTAIDDNYVSVYRGYAYSIEEKLRSRRYVQQFGAQRQSRIVRKITAPDVIRLDFKSCHFQLCHQGFEKLGVVFNSDGVEKLNSIKKFLENPELVYSCFSNRASGKKECLAILNGKQPSVNSTLLQGIAKESRFLRWACCSLYPAWYARFNNERRKWPEATTLSYWFQMMEDYYLEALESELESIVTEPKHLSLEFDGIGIDSTTASSIPDLEERLESGIYNRTGFHLKVVKKNDFYLLEQLESSSEKILVQNPPRELLKNGNCIPLAYWYGHQEARPKIMKLVKSTTIAKTNTASISPPKSRTSQSTPQSQGLLSGLDLGVGVSDSKKSMKAAPPSKKRVTVNSKNGLSYSSTNSNSHPNPKPTHNFYNNNTTHFSTKDYKTNSIGQTSGDCPSGYRYYGATAASIGLFAQCKGKGLLVEEGETVYVHIGFDNPHCICVERRFNTANIYNGKNLHQIAWEKFDSMISDCVEKGSIFTFILNKSPKPDCPNQTLLRLCAGATATDSNYSESLDSGSDSDLTIFDSNTESDADDDDETSELDSIADLSDSSSATSIKDSNDNKSDTNSYFKKVNAEALAIFNKIDDADTECLICPSRALGSAGALKKHFHIFHLNKCRATLSTSRQNRVAKALYDDDCFRSAAGLPALDQYCERSSFFLSYSNMRNDTNACMYLFQVLTSEGIEYRNSERGLIRIGNVRLTREMLNFVYTQSFIDRARLRRLRCSYMRVCGELASLVPGREKWHQFMSVVFLGPNASARRLRLINDLTDEFSSISIDHSYKVPLKLQGQVTHKRALVIKKKQPIPMEEQVHTIRCVKGLQGALLDVSTGQGEGVSELLQILDNFNHRQKMKIQNICTDRGNDANLIYKRAIVQCPNLKSVCLDPLHLAFSYETSAFRKTFAQKKTAGSVDMRKGIGKFSRVGGLSETPLYTPQTQVAALPKSNLDNPTMSVKTAKRIIEETDYSIGWHSISEILKFFTAVVVKHKEEMHRITVSGRSRRDVIIATITNKIKIQLMLNNGRFRQTLPNHERDMMAVGTTANEALASEIKSYFNVTQSLSHAQLRVGLAVFHSMKLETHTSARKFPPLFAHTQSEHLARLSSKLTLFTPNIWNQLKGVSSGLKQIVPGYEMKKKHSLLIQKHKSATNSNNLVTTKIKKPTVFNQNRSNSAWSVQNIASKVTSLFKTASTNVLTNKMKIMVTRRQSNDGAALLENNNHNGKNNHHVGGKKKTNAANDKSAGKQSGGQIKSMKNKMIMVKKNVRKMGVKK